MTPEEQKRQQKANERIRALDVQVIGSDGGNLGAMPLNKAI
jgi:translation initiation factor IF-3